MMFPAKESESLKDILRRVRQGDDAALLTLVEHYEPRLRAAAGVLLGPLLRSRLDSLDLVQSVHRVLLPCLREGRYQIAGSDDLVALALAIVRRKAARSWRSALKDEQALRESSPASPAEGSRETDPARTVQANDAVSAILGRLAPADQRLIQLRLDGHSTAEIARRSDSSPGVLRARLSRLRQRLRQAGCADWI